MGISLLINYSGETAKNLSWQTMLAGAVVLAALVVVDKVIKNKNYHMAIFLAVAGLVLIVTAILLAIIIVNMSNILDSGVVL